MKAIIDNAGMTTARRLTTDDAVTLRLTFQEI